jgi:hypothetical protein
MRISATIQHRVTGAAESARLGRTPCCQRSGTRAGQSVTMRRLVISSQPTGLEACQGCGLSFCLGRSGFPALRLRECLPSPLGSSTEANPAGERDSGVTGRGGQSD